MPFREFDGRARELAQRDVKSLRSRSSSCQLGSWQLNLGGARVMVENGRHNEIEIDP